MGQKNFGDNTEILFVTMGILLQRLINERSLDSYTHIILDEVHERELDSDFTMVALKELLEKNRNVKLILMSATFDSRFGQLHITCDFFSLFANYFATMGHTGHYVIQPEENYASSLIPAPTIQVGGKCYPGTLPLKSY